MSSLRAWSHALVVLVVLATSPADAASALTVIAWGDNPFGQTTIPGGLGDVTAVAAGGTHTVALKADGTVVAWGDNTWGQATVPANLTGVTAISAGGFHTVVLKSDGTVVAWGGGTTNACAPDVVNCGQSIVPAGLTGVKAIAAGRVHTLALKNDGTVVAWGAVGYDLGQTSVPAGLRPATAIAAGAYHSLALQDDGTVVAWGWNEFGQTNVPASLNGVKAMAPGFRFSVALKSDGSVVGWGGEGEQNIPVGLMPAGLAGVTAIASNFYDVQALKSDGTVVTWGLNALGAGNTPAGLSRVTAIAAGWFHTVALVAPLVTRVAIDIKPGSFPSSINLGSAGVVPVAILSSAAFDATQVDPATVTLAGAAVRLIGKAGKYSCQAEDVNSDGLTDLVCRVETYQLTIQPGESTAVLEAKTFSGEALRGEDIVRIVP
jgi:hypothetical protein